MTDDGVEHRNGLKSNHYLVTVFVILSTRSLVAVKPRRPPKTNVDTETAFRHDHCKTRVHIQKVNISEVRGQLIRSNSEVRVHAGAKFGHTGCLHNWVNDLQFLTRILTKFLKGFY